MFLATRKLMVLSQRRSIKYIVYLGTYTSSLSVDAEIP